MPSLPCCKAENLDMHSCIKDGFCVCIAKETMICNIVAQVCFSQLLPSFVNTMQGPMASWHMHLQAICARLHWLSLTRLWQLSLWLAQRSAHLSTHSCHLVYVSLLLCLSFCQALECDRHLQPCSKGAACSGLVVCRVPLHTVYALRIKRCHVSHLANRPSG